MTTSLYKGREEPLDKLPYEHLPVRNEVASRALIVWEDKVLLVWHNDHGQAWFTPGGRIKPGEPMQEALAREIEEETGLEVEIGDMVACFDTFTPREVSHKFEFLFIARPKVAPTWLEKTCVDADPTGAVDKMRWFTEAELANEPRVFPRFIRNFTSLLAPRPRAYYATKMEEGAPAEFEVNRFYISARTVTLHDGKVLMVRNHNSDWWYGAGGRIELGEALLETAVRELDEETGQNGAAHGVIAVDEFFSHTGKIHQINLYTACTLHSLQPFSQRANDYVAEARLFTAAELAAQPRAYPSYMAELAWPATTVLVKENV